MRVLVMFKEIPLILDMFLKILIVISYFEKWKLINNHKIYLKVHII